VLDELASEPLSFDEHLAQRLLLDGSSGHVFPLKDGDLIVLLDTLPVSLVKVHCVHALIGSARSA
jgi:hypothetical protein